MNNDPFTPFLSYYIYSLPERTRLEKATIKSGLDWLIYQLGLAKKWTPFRLPFFRQTDKPAPRAKTEPEFGEDISFISASKKQYFIFVAKDHELNNKNWTKENFDTDLRKAAAPDLGLEGLKDVRSVKIILAYNKDEDHAGVELYDRIVASIGNKIGKDIKLSFERWNLTRIVQEIKAHLLTADLMPQHLSAQFGYICSQVNDFDFGTKEWEEQLIPNWRSFVDVVLQSPVDERKVRLIPIALMILNHYRKDSPNSYPGWIDLIEWAMLDIWSCFIRVSGRGSKKLKSIIVEIWLKLYVSEIERYLLTVEATLTTQHALSLKKKGLGIGVSPVNDAYLAYWHIGRLGIMTLAPQDFETENKAEYDKYIKKVVHRSADWLVKCLHANPAALRPLVDLNHIELFLIWLILWQDGRMQDVYEWLSELESRLLVRRAHKHISVPFIEANSRLDLVAEYAATGERPYNYSDSSSYLLLMILELCFSLPDTQRDELLKRYMKRVIKGIGDDGQSLTEKEIDLQSWVPPEDWSQRILREAVLDGIAITTGNFERISEKGGPLSELIREFVEQTREKHPWKAPAGDVPLAAYILACIKHGSPLPPEFWRGTIFAMLTNEPNKKKKCERGRKLRG